MLIPSVFYDSYITVTGWTGNVRHNLRWYRYPMKLSSVELPSTITEVPYGKGNDVCHVKAEKAGVYVGDYEVTYGYFFGTSDEYRESYDYNDSLLYYTYTSPYYAVKTELDVLTDTPGQRINGTRWDFSVDVTAIRPYDKTRWRFAERGTVQIRIFVRKDNSIEVSYTRNSFLSFRETAKYIAAHVVAEDILPNYQYGHVPSRSLIRKIADRFNELYLSLENTITQWRSNYFVPSSVTAQAHLPSGDLMSLLLLDEWNMVRSGMTFKPYAGYHFNRLRQAAYLDCLDHVPKFNDNTISNIVEIVGFLKALIIDHRIEIPKSLSSAWLSYRYVYGTGKSDVEEAVSFVHRNVGDLLERGFDCYGSFTDNIQGTDITVRCHITMKQKELAMVENILSQLYRYGLSPSFYVFWDMVPYSFIVDWFIPVGDILKGYDTTAMYNRTYEMSDIWFSYSYNLDVDGSSFHMYTRFGSDALPEFQGYYTLDNKGSPSNKVIGFRVLDALSLIFK